MRNFLGYTLTLFSLVVLMSSCGARYYLETGKEDYNNLRYAEAREKFNTSLTKEPESYEAVKMLALTLQRMKDFDGASKAYQLALKYPQVTLEDKFNYAKMLMSTDKHADAELIFREYLTARPGDAVAKNLLESCQFIELFKDDTSRYQIRSLPLMDNLSMYSPVPYKEGLAYTAERLEKGKENPWTGNSYNDIYVMENNGSDWIGAEPMPVVINSRYSDGPISFDEKGEFAILTRSYTVNQGKKRKNNEQNYNNLCLYSTELIDGVWSPLKELSFNSEDFTNMHPALSSKGDTLYFASDREGGYGAYDLYISTKGANEKWSKPINLGSEVNSAANDVFPVLRKDGSINFSSDGHPSLGGLDIFRSERDESGQWNRPRNINYPINSTADDFGLFYVVGDTLGYFSSNRKGVDRIFEVQSKPSGIVFVNGFVQGPDSLPLQGAMVKLIDMKSGDVIEEIVVGDDGRFNFELAPDGSYKIESSKEGYLTESYLRSTVNQFEDEAEDVTLMLQKLELTDPNAPFDPKGSGVYKVPNINYDLNVAVIRADAAVELNKVLKIMKNNPTIAIELHAHTDAQFTTEYNLALSNRRAATAKAYLVKQGISESRIATRGFGETRIINRCKEGVQCSDSEHEVNRRTEFIVTSDGK
jgi:outer membrane protein OmpA-like peptidoglycan-associated protein/tetratricopeptide (TPR) repeat protein